MDCVVCKQQLQEYLSPVYDPQTQERFSILFCQACSLGQTWPQPRDLNPYYSSFYYGQRHGFTAHFCARRRLAWVEKMSQGIKGKLLDVGCGDGHFLQLAAEAGWQVAGLEWDNSPACAADLRVRRELSELQALAPFDCITLWHSLEHLLTPQTMLKELKNLLHPGGLLLLAVPNIQGWQARFFGANWLHWDVPRHLFHFNSLSLCHLLAANQFEPLRWWHQEFEYDLLGWSQSALNCISSRPNVFFNLLRGHSSPVSRLSRLLTGLLGVFLSALALPLLPLSAYFKAGGTIVVAARRAKTII